MKKAPELIDIIIAIPVNNKLSWQICVF